MNPTTDPRVKVLSMLMNVILEAIKASGSKGMPEGHLYAALMNIPNFHLDVFYQILEVMETSGKVTRSNHVVKAVV